jgi:thiol-disulfide isomerase/thioredoxin
MSSLEDFQKLLKSSDKPVLVMATAKWCGPCKLIKPIFIKESEKTQEAVFVIVDADEGQDIMIEYNITKIPVFKAFVKGEVVETLQGTNEAGLKKFITKYCNKQ